MAHAFSFAGDKLTRFVFVALGVALLSSTSAMAADLVVNEPVADVAVPTGFYATFFAGGSFASGETTIQPDLGPGFVLDTDLDGGFIIGGAIGMTLHQNLRGEIEFSYIQADVGSFMGVAVPDDVSVTSTGYNLLANLWYDFENDSGFTPYIGGGVGFGKTQVTSDDAPGDITASGLLYQLGAGVKVDVAQNIALDLGYRYRVLSDADTDLGGPPPVGASVTTDAVNHIVQAGVTFGF